MNELTNEVTEEKVMHELTVDELQGVNGGGFWHCIQHGDHWHCHWHEDTLGPAA